MNLNHAAVWIDHHEAKIFHVDAKSFDESTIRAPHRHLQRHSQTTRERDTTADEQLFFHEVARALEGATEILVVGPGTAKLAFIKHVHKHDRGLEPKIVGLETVDHPTDGQLAAYVRRYFKAVDRMRGISP